MACSAGRCTARLLASLLVRARRRAPPALLLCLQAAWSVEARQHGDALRAVWRGYTLCWQRIYCCPHPLALCRAQPNSCQITMNRRFAAKE